MSVLNLEKKILYIHIPKTAGTSMESAPFLQNEGDKHTNIEYFAKYLNTIQDLTMEDLWKFAFVRNPYDRFVSGVLNHVMPEAKTLIRDRFLEFVLKHKDKLGDFVPLQPMTDFVCIGKRLAVDWVGKYEHLESDWRFVCDKIGVDYYELPHLIKGKKYGSDYMQIYTPEVRKIVKKFYQRDFDLFHYEK